MNHLTVFSVLYLMMAAMSFVMGYYALRFDFKGLINRLFMLISLCLTFWALGFSVVIIAPDEATAILWTRISAVGYELIYSLLLHFTLAITGHKKLLSKPWFYALLYLPAAVCLYAFVLSPKVTQALYLFENAAGGWLRVTPSCIFDSIFTVYYLGAVMTSLILLVSWMRKNAERDIKKQALLLILSFIAAFGFGTLTDIVNAGTWKLPIPLMAPLFFLIPLSATFYCMDKYHFMKPQNVDKMELILNDERRAIVFKLASGGMILGGFILLLLGDIWQNADNAVLTLVSCALLMALGVALRVVRRAKKAYAYLEVVFLIASITLTLVLTLNMTQFGSVAIWAFPIMLIICALMFNSNSLLVAAAAPIALSQLYLVGVMPQRLMRVDQKTYFSQLAIVLFITFAAYYVHRIYVLRLRENAAQTKTQTLISDLAAGFSLAEGMPERIRELLTTLGTYFDAETVLFHVVESEAAGLIGLRQCSTNEVDIPEEALIERWYACLHKTQHEKEETPYIFIPVYRNEETAAFFYIEAPRGKNGWTKDQLVPVPVISRIVSDALDKLCSEAKIRLMAYFDSLTGLPSRQLFHDRAEQAIHLARRNSTTVGILFLDIDSFMSINDTVGHEGGDLLICAIGDMLTSRLRKSDAVSRFGDDEFLIMLNDISDVEDIAKVAQKVLDIFKEPIVLKGQEIFVTASAGISIYPIDGEDAETLVKHADMAMYTAKEKGKNQYALCSTDMKETVRYRVNLTNSLYRALECGELALYYQPQIDLATEKITGLEALLRWFHPAYGMIPPYEFISLAERRALSTP